MNTLKRGVALGCVALTLLFPGLTSNSKSVQRRPTRNPAIASIVRQIDARNIERTIRQLVSFGTRNTLSEQNDPKRGIGAARDWLYAEFQKIAETSGDHRR